MPHDLVFDESPGSRRLDVAVVTETYPPEINGVALTAARFVDGLRAAGHRVRVIRPRQASDPNGPADEQLLVRGVALPRYPSLKLGLPARRQLVRCWLRDRPDVVHVVTEGPLGWSAIQAAAHLGLPVVSDFRTNFHAYSAHYGAAWLARPIKAYLRRFHNRTAATLVPTRALREQLEADGFRRVRVVPRGIDLGLFDPQRRSDALRASWGAGADAPVFMHVGRLAAEKNLTLLASAFSTASRSNPQARLVVVGDGPEREALQARVPEAIFTGALIGERLADHLASADAFLFPSLTETWGNVTLEAMASGLALVAFNYAAAAELVVHERNGLVATPGNPGAFEAMAESLVADPERRSILGRAARASALEWGWPSVVRQLESALLAAMNARPTIAMRDGALVARQETPSA